MFEEIFLHKRVIPEKLGAYGFQKIGDAKRYCTDILKGEFCLEVTVGKKDMPDIKLTEAASGEEYILYRTNAAGVFVGKVRAAVLDVLQDICAQCYEPAVFKGQQSLKLIAYVREKYGDELEYLWEKSPNNAVWRRKDTAKWYGVLLTLSRRKLGFPSDEAVEIVDLRSDPAMLEQRIDHQRYFPGWHMNKKHWLTILLDGSVPIDEIFYRVDESYQLAKEKTK